MMMMMIGHNDSLFSTLDTMYKSVINYIYARATMSQGKFISVYHMKIRQDNIVQSW